jgi:glycerol-3-phosphate acyltransferase PlsY
MDVSLVVFKVLVAYLLGSVSGSLLLGRFRGVDIRTQGSGNAGGTNALRTQGWRFALGVVLIDVGKGVLAAALADLPPATTAMPRIDVALLCGLACAVGHVYPVFYGFRGGKGGAVTLGVLAWLLPWSLPWMVGIWLLVIMLTGYVGLATVCAAVALVPACWVLPPAEQRAAFLCFGVAMAALIVYAHRGNLQRVWAGTELRFERARVLTRFGRRSGA